MEDYNVFIGGLSGIFKGLKISQNKGIHNIKNLQKLKEITKRNEITFLNWTDKSEKEILIGYKDDQLVKTYDLNCNTLNEEKYNIVGEGPICGGFKVNGCLVTAVGSGVVTVCGDNSSTIETGGPLSRMRQSTNEEHIIGTGGKENDLKLWDLETGKHTFMAKNVRHDELELRVPVWPMDLAFRPETKQVAIATRYGQVRLYDPSTPTRRPVCEVSVKEHSFTCITPAQTERQYIVGCTTGNMYLVDLRGKGLLLNKYKGFAGSVRQIACLPTEPYIVSVSLDRNLRIHHLHSKKLIEKEYMQSRLSALLLKSTCTMEDIKEETEVADVNEDHEDAAVIKDDEEDEEYNRLFEKMEVIIDQPKLKKTNKLNVNYENESVERKEQVSLKRAKTRANTKKRKRDAEVVDTT